MYNIDINYNIRLVVNDVVLCNNMALSGLCTYHMAKQTKIIS